MSKEAKKYFIPVNGELVEVSEELYREYYRPIWNTRYHARKNGECSCTKAQLWKCDGVCPGCPVDYNIKCNTKNMDIILTFV